MATAAVIGLSGTALGCYTNNFDDGTLGLAEVFGDTSIIDGSLQLASTVTGTTGTLIVTQTYPQAPSWFDAGFDVRIDTNGPTGNMHLVFALGDVPDTTISDAASVAGLAVNINFWNVGGGNPTFVVVSVWRDGQEIFPAPVLGTSITTNGWVSDVPVSIQLDDQGRISVSVDSILIVDGVATGHVGDDGDRFAIGCVNPFDDLRVDNIDIQANPTTITNATTATTYPTLKSALSAASNGDTIELGAGIICEWGVKMPDNLELTIRGAGADQTCLSGEGQDWILRGEQGVFHLEGLTFANSFARVGNYAALSSSNGGASWTITDCDFISNDGNLLGASTIGAYSSATMAFERCRFMNNYDSPIAMVMVENSAKATFTDCLFAGNDPRFHLMRTFGGAEVEAVNCTFSAGHSNSSTLQAQQTFSKITAHNCVFDDSNGANVFGGPGIITTAGNLFPGATGANIDGVPTFADAANGDYRLATDSLGVDAADYDIYAGAGGGELDLRGNPRLADPCVANTGLGAFQCLDMGAFETPIPVVNLTSGQSYDTIADAVDAASDGDDLELGCGIYFEHDILIEKPITMTGQGMDSTTIDANKMGKAMIFDTAGEFGLTNLTITNGYTAGGIGGAIRINNSPFATISRVRFLNNEGSNGGAIATLGTTGDSGAIVIDACEFIGNAAIGTGVGAGSGGAITMFGSTPMYVVNSLFDGNRCNLRAGVAIMSEGSNGYLGLINCTIVGHDLSETGNDRLVIAQPGTTMALSNCVIADNEQFTMLANAGAVGAIRHCLFDDMLVFDGFGDFGGNIIGTPTFEDAANSDYRLAAGSLGIDAANEFYYFDFFGGPVDLAGDSRYRDDTGINDTGTGFVSYLDMGAYEFQGVTPQPCTGDVTGDQ
ncbi:MAG: hypothetical protein KDA30_14895, partial [Phycisphaerales bacterium]|nr:hypothetical protein [Phycisphaerales bacterium]